MSDVLQEPIFDMHSPAETAKALKQPRRGPVHRGPQLTEIIAALKNRIVSGKQRHKILVAFAEAGPDGRTDFENECDERLNMRRPSPGNRRFELEEDGLVVRNGDTRVIAATGNPAVVFRITEKGLAVLGELRRLEQHQQ